VGNTPCIPRLEKILCDIQSAARDRSHRVRREMQARFIDLLKGRQRWVIVGSENGAYISLLE